MRNDEHNRGPDAAHLDREARGGGLTTETVSDHTARPYRGVVVGDAPEQAHVLRDRADGVGVLDPGIVAKPAHQDQNVVG